MWWCHSIIPRPPLFFCFSVCVQYNTRKRKSAKNAEGLGAPIMWMTSGGREVDVRWTWGGSRGAVPDYKYRRNKPENEFLTGEAEYLWSCERLGSCLKVERSMIKSSTLFHVFECGPLPPYVHLASTWRHSCDRCSQAFPVFHALLVPCIANQRTK